jgi:hypothetical protein
MQCCDFTAAVNIQLLQNVVHMVFDGRRTKVQSSRNFLVCQTACDQRGDLSLSPG